MLYKNSVIFQSCLLWAEASRADRVTVDPAIPLCFGVAAGHSSLQMAGGVTRLSPLASSPPHPISLTALTSRVAGYAGGVACVLAPLLG